MAAPTCRVLVVTTFDLDDHALGAARAGAAGFLLKNRAVAELADAVRTVARGQDIVSLRATARLLRELRSPAADDTVGDVLSPRELEVVRLMVRGLSNKQIAAAAVISRATVESHVGSVLTKLGLSSRLQVAVWAYDGAWPDAGRAEPSGDNLRHGAASPST